MKFKLHQPTLDLLKGLRGIELGGSAHNPYGVDAINISPSGWDSEAYAKEQRDLGNEPLAIDKIGHASDIPAEDNSADFILSSHVIEHVPNPIAAFLEWQRVIKPGGYVVMIVPLPDAVPEDTRPLSTLAEIKKAYKDQACYGDTPPLIEGEMVFHYWKFDIVSMSGIIYDLRRGARGRPGLKWKKVGEESPDSKVGNGFWLAYKILV